MQNSAFQIGNIKLIAFRVACKIPFAQKQKKNACYIIFYLLAMISLGIRFLNKLNMYGTSNCKVKLLGSSDTRKALRIAQYFKKQKKYYYFLFSVS